jgi:DNA-binding response OmpR family regulator
MPEPARSVAAAALTAYARSQDRITSLPSGFHMHLVKPIDPLELVVAVATLAPRKARNELAAAQNRYGSGGSENKPYTQQGRPKHLVLKG